MYCSLLQHVQSYSCSSPIIFSYQSYVTCTVGVGWVGYVMICYGVTDAICSLVSGRLIKHVGRIPVFTFGALVHMALILTLLFWVPTKDQLAVCFVIAACWGASDAVWQTQINGKRNQKYRTVT